ncbi:hypothetical protein Tco_0093491 [Tanacetum coccineum]
MHPKLSMSLSQVVSSLVLNGGNATKLLTNMWERQFLRRSWAMLPCKLEDEGCLLSDVGLEIIGTELDVD